MSPTPAGDEAAGDEYAVARKLLAREVASELTPPDAFTATARILGDMHEQLALWLGRDGSQAVFARALDRARAHHAALAEVRLDFTEDSRRIMLTAVGKSGSNPDRPEIAAALAAFIAAVIALLTRLIGAQLVARLLGQLLPESPSSAASNLSPSPAEQATESHAERSVSRSMPQEKLSNE